MWQWWTALALVLVWGIPWALAMVINLVFKMLSVPVRLQSLSIMPHRVMVFGLQVELDGPGDAGRAVTLRAHHVAVRLWKWGRVDIEAAGIAVDLGLRGALALDLPLPENWKQLVATAMQWVHTATLNIESGGVAPRLPSQGLPTVRVGSGRLCLRVDSIDEKQCVLHTTVTHLTVRVQEGGSSAVGRTENTGFRVFEMFPLEMIVGIGIARKRPARIDSLLAAGGGFEIHGCPAVAKAMRSIMSAAPQPRQPSPSVGVSDSRGMRGGAASDSKSVESVWVHSVRNVLSLIPPSAKLNLKRIRATLHTNRSGQSHDSAWRDSRVAQVTAEINQLYATFSALTPLQTPNFTDIGLSQLSLESSLIHAPKLRFELSLGFLNASLGVRLRRRRGRAATPALFSINSCKAGLSIDLSNVFPAVLPHGPLDSEMAALGGDAKAQRDQQDTTPAPSESLAISLVSCNIRLIESAIRDLLQLFPTPQVAPLTSVPEEQSPAGPSDDADAKMGLSPPLPTRRERAESTNSNGLRPVLLPPKLRVSLSVTSTRVSIVPDSEIGPPSPVICFHSSRIGAHSKLNHAPLLRGILKRLFPRAPRTPAEAKRVVVETKQLEVIKVDIRKLALSLQQNTGADQSGGPGSGDSKGPPPQGARGRGDQDGERDDSETILAIETALFAISGIDARGGGSLGQPPPIRMSSKVSGLTARWSVLVLPAVVPIGRLVLMLLRRQQGAAPASAGDPRGFMLTADVSDVTVSFPYSVCDAGELGMAAGPQGRPGLMTARVRRARLRVATDAPGEPVFGVHGDASVKSRSPLLKSHARERWSVNLEAVRCTRGSRDFLRVARVGMEGACKDKTRGDALDEKESVGGSAKGPSRAKRFHLSALSVRGEWVPQLQLDIFSLVKTMVSLVINMKHALYSLVRPGSSGRRGRAASNGDDESPLGSDRVYFGRRAFARDESLENNGVRFAKFVSALATKRAYVAEFNKWFHSARAPWLSEPYQRVSLDIRDINLTAVLGRDVRLGVRAGAFQSDALPHFFTFSRVGVSVGSLPLVEMQSLRLRRVGMLASDADGTFTEEQDLLALYLNLSVTMDTIFVRVPPTAALGTVFDLTITEVQSLIRKIVGLPSLDALSKHYGGPGYTHWPEPPPPGAKLEMTNIRMEIVEHPLEAYVGRMRRLWLAQAAAADREAELLKLKLRTMGPQGKGGDAKDDGAAAMRDEQWRRVFAMYRSRVEALRGDILKCSSQPKTSGESNEQFPKGESPAAAHKQDIALIELVSGDPLASLSLATVQMELTLTGDHGDFYSDRGILRAVSANTPASEVKSMAARRAKVGLGLLGGRYFQLRMTRAQVMLRRYPFPLFSIDLAQMNGNLQVVFPKQAAMASRRSATREQILPFQIFYELRGNVNAASASFDPSYVYALRDVGVATWRSLPRIESTLNLSAILGAVMDFNRTNDDERGPNVTPQSFTNMKQHVLNEMLTGRICLDILNTVTHIFRPPQAGGLVDPEKHYDKFLDIKASMSLRHSGERSIELKCRSLSVQEVPFHPSQPHLLELPQLTVALSYQWACLRRRHAHGDACTIEAFVDGEICGANGQEPSLALQSATLAWLVDLGKGYSRIPPLPFPKPSPAVRATAWRNRAKNKSRDALGSGAADGSFAVAGRAHSVGTSLSGLFEDAKKSMQLSGVYVRSIAIRGLRATLWDAVGRGPSRGLCVSIDSVTAAAHMFPDAAHVGPLRSPTLTLGYRNFITNAGQDAPWVLGNASLDISGLKANIVANKEWRELEGNSKMQQFYKQSEDSVVVETYENQRFNFIYGWGHRHMLPTDRPPWSNKQGTIRIEKGDCTLPSPDWEWQTEWRLDYDAICTGATDDQGWEYAFNFAPNSSLRFFPVKSWTSHVRRRRWIRVRGLKASARTLHAPEGKGADGSGLVFSAAQLLFLQAAVKTPCGLKQRTFIERSVAHLINGSEAQQPADEVSLLDYFGIQDDDDGGAAAGASRRAEPRTPRGTRSGSGSAPKGDELPRIMPRVHTGQIYNVKAILSLETKTFVTRLLSAYTEALASTRLMEEASSASSQSPEGSDARSDGSSVERGEGRGTEHPSGLPTPRRVRTATPRRPGLVRIREGSVRNLFKMRLVTCQVLATGARGGYCAFGLPLLEMTGKTVWRGGSGGRYAVAASPRPPRSPREDRKVAYSALGLDRVEADIVCENFGVYVAPGGVDSRAGIPWLYRGHGRGPSILKCIVGPESLVVSAASSYGRSSESTDAKYRGSFSRASKYSVKIKAPSLRVRASDFQYRVLVGVLQSLLEAGPAPSEALSARDGHAAAVGARAAMHTLEQAKRDASGLRAHRKRVQWSALKFTRLLSGGRGGDGGDKGAADPFCRDITAKERKLVESPMNDAVVRYAMMTEQISAMDAIVRARRALKAELLLLAGTEIDVHVESIEASLLHNRPFLALHLGGLHLRMLTNADSSTCKIKAEVSDLSVQNLFAEDSLWRDVVTQIEQGASGGLQDGELVVANLICEPRETQTVVPHLEVHLRPLNVKLTHRLVTALASFFSTAKFEKKNVRRRHEKRRQSFVPVSMASVQTSALSSATSPTVRNMHALATPSTPVAQIDPDRERFEAFFDRLPDTLRKARQLVQSNNAGESTGGGVPQRRFLFRRARFGPTHFIVSYTGWSKKGIANVKGLRVNFSGLLYKKKLWALSNFAARLKRDLILGLLSQLGDALADFLAYKLGFTERMNRRADGLPEREGGGSRGSAVGGGGQHAGVDDGDAKQSDQARLTLLGKRGSERRREMGVVSAIESSDGSRGAGGHVSSGSVGSGLGSTLVDSAAGVVSRSDKGGTDDDMSAADGEEEDGDEKLDPALFFSLSEAGGAMRE